MRDCLLRERVLIHCSDPGSKTNILRPLFLSRHRGWSRAEGRSSDQACAVSQNGGLVGEWRVCTDDLNDKHFRRDATDAERRTEPMERKKPNVAAEVSMVCDSVDSAPLGPGPANSSRAPPKMKPMVRPTMPVVCQYDPAWTMQSTHCPSWRPSSLSEVSRSPGGALEGTPGGGRRGRLDANSLLSNVEPPCTVCGGGGIVAGLSFNCRRHRKV